MANRPQKPSHEPKAAKRAQAKARGRGGKQPPKRKPAKPRQHPMATPVGGDELKGRDAGTGRFQPGNDFWTARAASGPGPMFVDGEALWAACVRYFEWVKASPLYEDQVIAYQGMATHVPVAKMRAMTKRDLCRFLGIERTTWASWKDRPELARTIEDVESVIWSQKFTGAAAGLLNANIIARELGLADKQEVSGEGGGSIKYEDLTPKRPSEDHMADMAERFLGGLRKHAPEVAARLEREVGPPAPRDQKCGGRAHCR